MKAENLIIIGSIFGLSLALIKPWTPPSKAAPYLSLLDETERKYNMPKNLLVRLAYQESHFRNDLINGPLESSAGAQGIMQIIPRWHPDVNPWNTDDAIPYAGKYLYQLFARFGNWKHALAAYNWGPTNLKKYLDGKIQSMPKETKNYVSQISKDIPIT